jgi:hypothetical protein
VPPQTSSLVTVPVAPVVMPKPQEEVPDLVFAHTEQSGECFGIKLLRSNEDNTNEPINICWSSRQDGHSRDNIHVMSTRISMKHFRLGRV